MSDAGDISRRDLLRGKLRRREPAESKKPRIAHRPPGAVPESDFLAGCTRCGECITACPADAIRIAGREYGPAAGTPVIEPMQSPCVMCIGLPCIDSCEPNVLSPEAPVRMGTARIERFDCMAWQGTFCTVCSERCPVEGAISVDGGKPTIVEETCTGCGVCQHVCPAPYNAVLVLPDGAAEATDEPEPPPPDAFDWRAAYFKGRSLRPPEA